jgi:hypothetical protein
MELFNHWYWSRAEIGPYNVIASEMIAEKEFNNESTIVLTSQKTGKITDNGEYVTLYRTIGKMHPTLDKVSDNLLLFMIAQKMNIDMSIISIKRILL